MNQLRAITVAGFLAATVLRRRHRDIGRWRYIPLSGLCQMGGHLQKGHRCRAQLSVDRFRWRH